MDMNKKGWENSSYAEYSEKIRIKFAQETADYLKFMEDRHKVASLDYISTLEHDNKMKDSEIEQLKKEIEQLKPVGVI